MTGSDGNLWFVDDGTTPAIGRVTVEGGEETGGGGGTSPSDSTPSTTPPTGVVGLSKKIVKAKANGTALVSLHCAGTAACKGAVELAVKGGSVKKKARAAGKAKTTVIGKTKFSIAAGKTATVAVKLNATGRGLLKAHHGKITATLTVTKLSPSPASTIQKTVHIVQ